MSVSSKKVHRIRTKDGGTIDVENYGRAKAIKLQCTACCGFGEAHPRDCTDKYCPLYPYRGKMLAAYHKEEE